MNDPKQHNKPSTTHHSNNLFSGETPFFTPKNKDSAPKETDVLQAKGLFGDQPAFFQPAQAKLKIGQPGDKYEQEADNLAEQVVSQGRKQNTSSAETDVQRSAASEEQVQKMESEVEAVQSKSLGERITPLVQRGMKPAEELQKKTSKPESVQAKEEEIQAKEEEESLQAKTEEETTSAQSEDALNPIQRCAECDEVQAKEEDDSLQAKEEETQAPVQMMGGSDDSGSSNLESQLSSSKGGGQPMDSDTRSQMESGFGKDFSGVRIHDGANAAQMNQSLGAQAFTHGNDIYFNEGKYKPGSEDGDRLLAHELTHTVQQGASTQPSVQQKKDPEPEIGKPSSRLDISHRFELNKEWADYLDAQYKKGKREFMVDVKIGERYSGTIKMRKLKANETGETAKYDLVKAGTDKYLEITGWSFLDPVKGSLTPILVLNPFGEEQTTTGFLSVKLGEKALTSDVAGFIKGINSNLEQMRFLGLKPLEYGEVENTFASGRLVFQVGTMSTVVDGFLEAGGGMGITGDSFTFNLSTKVDVAGLVQGEFTIARAEDGSLSGSGDIETEIANVQAKVHVEYLEGIVTIQGTGRIESDKFSGEITLLVTDAERSRQMMHAALGVESMDAEQESAETTPKPKAKGNQVLAGWGEVKATITPWLEGTAKVGIDAEGHVTIVGEIAVPNQIELMEQRGKKVDIFKLEIRAGYGIPLVGQVFLFASIGMFMNAGFGPLVLKDVAFTGTYSTDPSVLQEFSITGTLGINAFAILGLETEAGVGLTLLGHDVKAGVNVTAAAGLRAYAEATPTLQYSEQASPEGGKVGETHLKGHFEAAAQLFAQLSGAFFVEIDAPWWSPVSDGREEYPMGEVQYPIGDTMGIGADMDWLVGSPDIPEVKFSPVEFDADKFTSDIMADPPPRKYGKSDADEKGEWVDGNAPGDQKENPELKDGEGLPENDKKKEDLKNLPDEEKYMRALDEMSKLEKASPKATMSVVNAKAVKVKAKYGLDKITVKDKDDQAEIFVKHKKEDNGEHLLLVPLMSEGERMKLLAAAMDDLNKKSNAAAAEDGTIEESKAKELLANWKKENPIIEEAHVVESEQTWDYFVDLGDKSDTVKGNKKAGDKDAKNAYDHRTEFQDNTAHKHSMYFQKEGKAKAKIIVQSEPIKIDKLLDDAAKIATGDKKTAIEAIIARQKALLKYIEDNTDDLGKPDESNMSEKLSAYIETELAGIAADIRAQQVFELVPLPLTKVTHAMAGGKPSQVKAEPLSINSGNTTGSKDSENPVGWDLVETFLYGNYYVDESGSHHRMTEENEEQVKHKNYKIIFKPDNWIRFHILNEDLHGPGVKWNLLSSSNTDNINYQSQIEGPVKDQVTKSAPAPVYFDIKVTEWRSEIPFTAVQKESKEFTDDIQAKYGESYKKLPLKIVANAGYMKKGEGDNYIHDESKGKILDNKPFQFANDVDVTVTPGHQVVNIINQGAENNSGLGISLKLGRFLKENRDSLNSVSKLVNGLLADGTRSIETVRNYLGELVSALGKGTNTKSISLFAKDDGSASISELNTYIRKLDEITSTAPNKSTLDGLKSAKKLRTEDVFNLYQTIENEAFELKGITFIAPKLTQSTIGTYLRLNGSNAPAPVAHLLAILMK